jgi:hypothetical protein
VHLTGEAPGLTAWPKRTASARYSQHDSIRNSAIGLASTAAAGLAVTRSESRPLDPAYYRQLFFFGALDNR